MTAKLVRDFLIYKKRLPHESNRFACYWPAISNKQRNWIHETILYGTAVSRRYLPTLQPQFFLLFVNTVHITPNNYLLNIRLSAAKTLLATTTMPLSEVAEKCGFHSQAYFSDCFLRHFHMSPRHFRETFRHPDESVGWLCWCYFILLFDRHKYCWWKGCHCFFPSR